MRSDGQMYYFEYSLDGQTFTLVDQLDCSLLSTEVIGGFTGVMIGMYSIMNHPGYLVAGRSYAEFDYFDYQEY